MEYVRPYLGTLKGYGVSLGRRMIKYIASLPSHLVPQEGWLTFVLLAFVLFTVIWSVETAQWITRMPSLSYIVLIALLVGLVVAKIRLPGLLLHPIGLLLGSVVVAWQTCLILPGEGWEARFIELTSRLSAWFNVARTGGISNDSLAFAVQLACLAWLIAYISAWFVFHSRKVWGGVIPSGVAILVNLSYLPRRFGILFALYLLASMLLVMRLNLVSKQREWRESHTAYPRGIGGSFLGSVLLFGTALLVFIWQLPLGAKAPSVAKIWGIGNEPWKRFEAEFNRLNSSLTSQKPAPLHYFGDTLPFKGTIRLGANVVLTVRSDRPGYWRANTYDVYTGQGWLTSERVSQPLGWTEAQVEPQEYLRRQKVMQTVKTGFATNVLFASSMPVRASLDALQETTRPTVFTISLEDSSKDVNLPADIQPLAEQLRQVVRTENPLTLTTELPKYLPDNIKLVDIEKRGITGTGVRVERLVSLRLERVPSELMDITALRSSRRLERSEQYTVESSVSKASVNELRAAGEDYPGWVLDRFLQLPSELPIRVRQLAEALTLGNENAYDKATAIEGFLRGIEYSTEIPAPPYGSDGVDHFLFGAKSGYCDYYASAMVVMLRSVGVPARVATGYSSGDYDAENDVYVVRELHAHTWPEVFFPGYGWVEFEPTSSLPPIARTLATTEEEGTGELGGGEAVEDFIEPDFPLPEEGVGSIVPSRSFWEGVPWQLALLPSSLLILLLMVWYFWQRSLSKLAYPAQVYVKMCQLASLAGLGPEPQKTPREYASKLSNAFPQGAEDVSRIAEGYMKAEYGRKTIVERERQAIERAWQGLRKELLLKILRWRRTRERRRR